MLKIISALASVLAFAGAVLLLWPTTENYTAGAQSVRTNSNAAPPTPPPPVIDDFVPEFHDLPTFDELSKSRNAEPSTTNLVDIGEFITSDRPWPSYSKEDVTIKSGERWLGLYGSAGGLFFAETKLTRSPRHGFIGPGDKTYDWLKYERKGDIVFIVKGISALTPGKVNTLFWNRTSDDQNSMEIGFRRVFRLNGKDYSLRVTTGVQRDGGKVNVLVLESDGVSQIVKFNHYYKDHNTLYDSIGDLLWVGDMDGDGRLDLYFSDYGYEKGGFGSRLFLSSEAKNGDLLGIAASFGTGGC